MPVIKLEKGEKNREDTKQKNVDLFSRRDLNLVMKEKKIILVVREKQLLKCVDTLDYLKLLRI